MKTIIPRSCKGLLWVLTVLALLPMAAMAQTEATDIAEGAQTVFNVVAPIVVTIAVFFIGVRIAKRVTRG